MEEHPGGDRLKASVLGAGPVPGRAFEDVDPHPDAIIKRGRANKWETWPSDA